MSKEIEEILTLFDKKLRSDRLNKTSNSQNDIMGYYFQLLDGLTADYETYRKYFPSLLSTIEQNDAKACSISIFFQLYEEVISSCNIRELDVNQFTEKVSPETSDKFFKQFTECIKSVDFIRISDFDYTIEGFSDQEIKECVSLLVNMLQFNSETIEWSEEQAENLLIQLAFMKKLLNSLGNAEYFYFVISMFLDRLNSSEFFQAARDVAEEIVLSSFNDGVPELGFLNSYHCYSRQTSLDAAILYANMTLFRISISKKPMPNKLAQEIIWESIKYFRNVKIYPFAIRIYENIPSEVVFSAYERRAIDHSYFSCLFFTKDKMLPGRLLNYLHKEREDILRAGPQEAQPWLLALHNIKRIYPDADFSQTGLGFYLNTFGSMVPNESNAKFIKIIQGNSEELKNYLKLSLIKLNETRNENDLVHDNDRALTTANRLIEYSFANKDDEAILLAMMIKSDFSLIFQSKETSSFRQFILPNDNLENFNSLYSNYQKVSEILSNSESELIIWLAVTEGRTFQLSLYNGEFIFSDLKLFDWNAFHDLKKSNYFSCLSFDDEIKDQFGMRDVTGDEYIKQAKEIQNNLNFGRLSSTEKATSILIVKDMELARFPHNLMLDEHGSFVHSQKPITNILSTEWFFSCKDQSNINSNFSKSIWIPTEGGDITLNKLHDSLEPELIKHEFNIYTKLNISAPISTELNIICSHGAQDIASHQVLYPGEKPLENLTGIVGAGKILIFFVCHSGSYNNEYFRNNITSIVKTYISLGYKAVIAPCWSLHVNIPKIWLDNFINSINKGFSVSNCLFVANKSVSKKYPTPAAWACMHLYGNPYLSIKN